MHTVVVVAGPVSLGDPTRVATNKYFNSTVWSWHLYDWSGAGICYFCYFNIVSVVSTW